MHIFSDNIIIGGFKIEEKVLFRNIGHFNDGCVSGCLRKC